MSMSALWSVSWKGVRCTGGCSTASACGTTNAFVRSMSLTSKPVPDTWLILGLGESPATGVCERPAVITPPVPPTTPPEEPAAAADRPPGDHGTRGPAPLAAPAPPGTAAPPLRNQGTPPGTSGAPPLAAALPSEPGSPQGPPFDGPGIRVGTARGADSPSTGPPTSLFG